MTTVMILGAHGATAQIVTKQLLAETSDHLILYLRQAQRLAALQSNPQVTLVDGDVLDTAHLTQAMMPVDIVYSNVGGANLAQQTRSILQAMQQAKKQRLIFMSALGAHHEVPGDFGQWNEHAIAAYLPGFRESAQMLAQAPVTYTEVRPAWLTNQNEVAYETTKLGEPFKGTEVSRASVADYIVRVIKQPTIDQNASIGLNKPNTAGPKPAWL